MSNNNRNKARVRPGRRGFVGWGKRFHIRKAEEAQKLAAEIGGSTATDGKGKGRSYRPFHIYVLSSAPKPKSEGWVPIVVTGSDVLPVTMGGDVQAMVVDGDISGRRVVTGPGVSAMIAHSRGQLGMLYELVTVTARQKERKSVWEDGQRSALLMDHFWRAEALLSREL